MNGTPPLGGVCERCACCANHRWWCSQFCRIRTVVCEHNVVHIRCASGCRAHIRALICRLGTAIPFHVAARYHATGTHRVECECVRDRGDGCDRMVWSNDVRVCVGHDYGTPAPIQLSASPDAGPVRRSGCAGHRGVYVMGDASCEHMGGRLPMRSRTCDVCCGVHRDSWGNADNGGAATRV